MSLEGGRLPLIGPKLHTRWGSTHGTGRRDKVQIWSAVALQQHFSREAFRDGALPSADEPPPPLPNGRLTLAQKMGLVPLPPPAPTEEEWTRIEGTALRRNVTVPLGENTCCICQEAFYATMEQGQVLLSCSHVFHEQCFRHFEKFVRQSHGKGDTQPLSCPVCRNRHYHKRIFYAGKALAQRAAIVKIQAFFRRVLARKAYVKLRLENDMEFCGEYARERLARLSDAYAAYAEQREKEQLSLLAAMDLRLQLALAECTTPAAWSALRERVAAAAREDGLDCPICLCAIERNPHGDSSHQSIITGEDVIAALRKEYNARVAKQRAGERKKSECPKAARKRAGGAMKVQPVKSTTPPVTSLQVRRVTTSDVSNTSKGNEAKRSHKPALKTPGGPRYGLLLSCGHCFHETCLSTFEHYSKIMAVEGNSTPLILRCPLCRSAYVKVNY